MMISEYIRKTVNDNNDYAKLQILVIPVVVATLNIITVEL